MSVQILIDIKPAEAYLILENKKASFKELLRYTLIDLVVKKVLALEFREMEGEDNPLGYVSRGVLYSTYSSAPFENVFLSHFRFDSDLEYDLPSLAKVAYQKAEKMGTFVFHYMAQGEMVVSCLKVGFWQKLLGNIRLNEHGERQRKKLQDALHYLVASLPADLSEHPEAVTKLLQSIGGNLYLLEAYDKSSFERLSGIFSEVEDEHYRQLRAQDSGFVFVDSAVFWAITSDFDSGYDSASSTHGDGGSGCGGDSGCSGCGGCGGCGG
ncbi:MAG TPA: hypothetical protein DCE41_11575 [Cytophagales bacterium]|nr:hypothetical protein [Cytophagales bacterium]HAA22332.1 hypothetical protein [Cytophagales bacterium]HAP60457.1 hypothetical protein [Cytophagales bacterium]